MSHRNSESDAQVTLESFSRNNTVPYLGLERVDFWVIALPTLGMFGLSVLFDLGILGYLTTGVICLASMLLVYLAPSYLSCAAWLQTLRYYVRRPTQVLNLSDADAERPESIFERIQVDESTQDLTHVKQYYPGRGVIRRDDGRMVGALKLEPRNMDFAEGREWDQVTTAAAEFANNDLDFPLQLYVTTRDFPIEGHIQQLEDRQHDADIADNPVLKAVLEDTIDQRPQDLADNGTSTLHYYLIAEVGAADVIADSSGDKTALEKLSKIPVLGIFVNTVASYREGLSKERRRARMLSKLDKRLRTIEREFVQDITGHESRRVSVGEWIVLLEEFWHGEQPNYQTPSDLVRSQPAVTGEPPQGTTQGSIEDHTGDDAEGDSDEEAVDESSDDVDGKAKNEDGIAEKDESTEKQEEADDAGLLARVRKQLRRPRRDELEEVAAEELDADPETESAAGIEDSESEVLDDISDLHQRQVAPEGLERNYRSVKTSETNRQVLFVDNWPDVLGQGAFRQLFTTSAASFDFSLHFSPRDRQRAQSKAESRYTSLNAAANTTGGGMDGGDFAATDKLRLAEKAGVVRDQIKDGQRPFKTSCYISVTSEDEEGLRDEAEAVRSVLQDAPANVGLSTVAGKQVRALESVSPIGIDQLRKEQSIDPSQIMLGRGVGALLSSCTQSDLLEEGGVEMGEHSYTGTPVIKDPFQSETNYNWVVIGDSGSGKSYQSKLVSLRSKLAKDDLMLVILDPLEGFAGLSEAMDAERITIGGDRGLNPLEIRAPTEYSARNQPADLDPLSAKISDVMSFFDNFAYQQGIELGTTRQLLESAVKEAYSRAGITHDISTHHKQSPTISDVLDILQEMADHPEEHVLRTKEESEIVQDHATRLLNNLRPFIEGSLQNLAEETEFNLRDEDVVYLDLSQQENSQSGGDLTMQLVFSLVYERCKETPKDVIFLIDEARFLMRNAKNLEFLGQRVRHTRHYDTSIRFITQNIQDFFAHEEAESIINNSFVKMLHRTEEIREWADHFDLSRSQVNYVETAKTGKRAGYSEALVEIDSTWYPLQIFSTEAENAVVDFDARDDSVSDLPGMGEAQESPTVRYIKQAISERVSGDSIAREARAEVSHRLTDTQQEVVDILNEEEMVQVLEAIENGGEPEAMVVDAIRRKFDHIFGDVEEELMQELESRLAEAEGRVEDPEKTAAEIRADGAGDEQGTNNSEEA